VGNAVRKLSARKFQNAGCALPSQCNPDPFTKMPKTRRRAKMLLKVTNEHQEFVNAAQTEIEKESRDVFVLGHVVS
jgi:hypothetical protein